MIRRIAGAMLSALFLLAAVGCPKDARHDIEEAVEEVKDETRDAVEEVKDEIDDATKG